MPENKTLVRPDGSTVTVPAEDAEKLKVLNYRDQSPEEETGANIELGRQEYYDRPGQKAKVAAEGFFGGLTFGATDLGLNDADREASKYNPGWRLGFEALGALASMHPSMPGGLLSEGAKAIGESVSESRFVQRGIQGAIEGGVYGAGGAVSQAELNGDPITAEAIGAGLGWGALFGGGLSALGGGVEGWAENRAAKKLAAEESAYAKIGAEERTALERAEADARVHAAISEGMVTEHKALAALEDGHYQHFANNMADAAERIKIAGKVGEDVVTQAAPDFTGLKMSQQKIYSGLLDSMNLEYVKPQAKGFVKEFAAAQLAAKEGKYEAMISHLDRFKEHMATIENTLGKPMFNADKVIEQANTLVGVGKARMDGAVKAAEELTQYTAVGKALGSFPKTASEFAAMTPKRAEALAAAVEAVGKFKGAEFAGVKEAVKESIGHLAEGLGLKLEGTPGAQLREMQGILKKATGARAAKEMEMLKQGNLLWGEANKAQDTLEKARMAGDQVKLQAKKGRGGLGTSFMKYEVGKSFAKSLGTPGYLLGYGLVSGLVGLKGAILSTIAEKAAAWAPRVSRGLQKYGPRVEPLLRRLDGTKDEEHKTRIELMRARSQEVVQAAGGVRDTLYKGMSPLTVEHPELAAQLHDQSVKRFQFLLDKMPKDPGLAMNGLKSMWKPDPVAVEKFARYYEVFHDPVGVMTRALQSGKITMEAAEGMREMNPELFGFLRVQMLERISDDKVMSRLSYNDQVELSVLLDLPVHSSMDPRFISAQQQMFTERNQPLEMNPRITPGGGAGRPAGPGPNATSAQRITEH